MDLRVNSSLTEDLASWIDFVRLSINYGNVQSLFVGTEVWMAMTTAKDSVLDVGKPVGVL